MHDASNVQKDIDGLARELCLQPGRWCERMYFEFAVSLAITYSELVDGLWRADVKAMKAGLEGLKRSFNLIVAGMDIVTLQVP